METKAHYALVGFFAIGLIAAVALFAIWLGQTSFDRAYKEFDVVFVGPVRGLTESSEVRFNGIKVGEVTQLGLDQDDPSLVVARVRVAELTPVTRDTVAQLEPQGLTGLNYIQLNAGSPDADAVVARAGNIPRISSRPAQLESLIESSEDIARNANMALARINVLLSETNMQHISATIENVRLLSDELADADRPDNLANKLGATLDAVNTAAVNIDTLMRGDVATMVQQTTVASVGVNQAATDAVGFMEDIHGPVVRFSNDGLDDLTLALSDLRRVLVELEAIASGVEDNPAAFVSGTRREEVEIPR